MSSDEASAADEQVEVLFEQEEIESSEDPPWEEWSSLYCFLRGPEVNEKRRLYEEGLYQPPSGEICAKYIAISDSSVFRHPYYPYPAVVDPGIKEALLQSPRKTIFADDGQELYLSLCKEMGECPVRIFYKQLLEDKVDLKYYGVSPYGARPMAIALTHNRIVRSVDFTDNFLNEDACYHLGQLFLENFTVTELILSGCRIGPEGIKRLVENLHHNRSLVKLDISRCQLKDEGVEHLGQIIYKGSVLSDINLSYNNMTAKSAQLLADAIEFNNVIKSLDLSWNSLLVPKPFENLCNQLIESEYLEEVNLSWNALSSRFGNFIKNLLLPPNMKYLYLSNNKLSGESISLIANNLPRAKKLITLDLSYNPMSVDEARTVLRFMGQKRVKLQNLLMDGVYVDENFIKMRTRILNMKFRKDAEITHGYMLPKFAPKHVDMRDLVLTRAQFVCSKPKKKRVDVGLMILQLQKMVQNQPIAAKELPRYVKMLGAFQMNDDLVEELAHAFPGPKKGKFKTANVEAMADFVKRKWPDTKLPPTPPPTPPPPPPPPPAKDKGKGKKGKK